MYVTQKIGQRSRTTWQRQSSRGQRLYRRGRVENRVHDTHYILHTIPTILHFPGSFVSRQLQSAYTTIAPAEGSGPKHPAPD